jgi:hypothetical protein
MKQAARSIACIGTLALAGCGGTAKVSLSSANGTFEKQAYVADVDHPEGRSKGSDLETLHIDPEACSGLDTKPDFSTLGAQSLRSFLDAQGIAYERTEARSDLEYLDVAEGAQKVRLRVATLDTARAAGRDLHEALLQHGPGSWGVHRSNIAVLGPASDVEAAIGYSLKTKLACWGVLTVAGRDDTFVVRGGYSEL